MANRLGLLGGLAAVLLGCAAPARADLLVSNGGFETGDFTGWTLSGNSATNFVADNPVAPHGGKFAAQLGAIGSLGYLSQSLATVPGQSYSVSFWLQGTPGAGAPNAFQASFGGTTLVANTDYQPPGTWAQFSYKVAATSATSVLQFAARQDHGFVALDDVVVSGASGVVGTPEPAGLTLLGLGVLGLAGWAGRRRRACGTARCLARRSAAGRDGR